MKKLFIMLLIAASLLAVTYFVISNIPLVDTSDKADIKIVSTMDSLRADRDKVIFPLQEQVRDLEEQICSIEQDYAFRIDSFKNLLSKKYYDDTMDLCRVGAVECSDRKKNITMSEYSSNPLIEEVKAEGNQTINLTDYNKLDTFFALKHSPLNGYGFSFVKYAKQYGVDADFGVCITWADSRSGKQLTTPNNWGNVHNNDSGNRVGFATPEEGIEVIFSLIGNGTYQQENHSIGDFSNGGRIKINKPTSGNKGVFVYATSEYNWNKNVIECMNELKDFHVNEYFDIRSNK